MSLLFTFDPNRPKTRQPEPPAPTMPAPDRDGLCDVVIDYLRAKDARRMAEAIPSTALAWTRREPSRATVQAAELTLREVLEVLMARPDAGEWFRHEAFRMMRENAPAPTTTCDWFNITTFALALQERDVQRLQQAIEDAIKRKFTAEDTAALAQWFSERAATLANSPRQSRTPDARAARAKLVTDYMDAMTDDDQQHALALAAALANGTPNRAARIRKAIQNYIRQTFAFDDFAWMAGQCINWMKQGRGTQTRDE